MTVKQLKKLLEKVDENRIVILQLDTAGTYYNNARGVDDNARYTAGDVKFETLTPKQVAQGFTDEDTTSKGKRALVIFP